MKHKKSTIFVTGGAGYIGSHIVQFFLKKGYAVVIFDNLSTGYREAVKVLEKQGTVTFVRGDLKNKKSIVEALKKAQPVEAVVHVAGVCSVNESMERPGRYFENNTLGTLNLLQAMKESGTKLLVFSSTCATYGEAEYLPVDEKHVQLPTNPYGESKFLAERMIRWYGKVHGFHYALLRYFNVCGASEDGRLGDSKKPSPHLVQNAVRGAMGIEKFSLTYPIVSTPDGTPVRDYVDILDLAQAHYSAFRYLKKGGESDAFNLATGQGYSVKYIISEVEKAFHTTLDKIPGKQRKGEYAQMYAISDKALKKLGWKTKRSLAVSIQSLQKWYSEHPHGYRK